MQALCLSDFSFTYKTLEFNSLISSSDYDFPEELGLTLDKL